MHSFWRDLSIKKLPNKQTSLFPFTLRIHNTLSDFENIFFQLYEKKINIIF